LSADEFPRREQAAANEGKAEIDRNAARPNRRRQRLSAPTSAILPDRCGGGDDYARHSTGKILNRIAASEIRQMLHAAGESRPLGKGRSNASRVNIAHSAAAACRSVVLDRQADELAHPVAVEQQQHVTLSRRLL
jgi:hypothetical protein